MANGGIRRFVAGAGALAVAAMACLTPTAVDIGPRRNAHRPGRVDVDLGRWSYQRKGKRTAAQQKRAARKKRNRARNK